MGSECLVISVDAVGRRGVTPAHGSAVLHSRRARDVHRGGHTYRSSYVHWSCSMYGSSCYVHGSSSYVHWSCDRYGSSCYVHRGSYVLRHASSDIVPGGVDDWPAWLVGDAHGHSTVAYNGSLLGVGVGFMGRVGEVTPQTVTLNDGRVMRWCT